MKTDNNLTVAPSAEAEAIVNELETITLAMPNERILAELQTVVERVSFSGLDGMDYATSQPILNEIFSDGISITIMEFIWQTAHKHGLEPLGGQKGRQLLEYCSRRFRQEGEVTVITAIELRPEMQQTILAQLKPQFPTSAKIVFQVVPTTLAGFVIKNGNDVHDYSLRQAAPGLLKRYAYAQYKQRLTDTGAVHG